MCTCYIIEMKFQNIVLNDATDGPNFSRDFTARAKRTHDFLLRGVLRICLSKKNTGKIAHEYNYNVGHSIKSQKTIYML